MAAAQVVTSANLGGRLEIPIVREDRVYGHVSLSALLKIGPDGMGGGNFRSPNAMMMRNNYPPHGFGNNSPPRYNSPPRGFGNAFGSPSAGYGGCGQGQG